MRWRCRSTSSRPARWRPCRGSETQLEPSTPRPFAKTPFAAVRTDGDRDHQGEGDQGADDAAGPAPGGNRQLHGGDRRERPARHVGKDRAVALKMMHTLRDQPVGPQEPAESG